MADPRVTSPGNTDDEEPEGPTILEMLLQGRAAPEEAAEEKVTDVIESLHADVDAREEPEPADEDELVWSRVAPPPPVVWDAVYRLHDDPGGQWRECRVSDISSTGARLKFFDITAEQMEGRRVEVQVQLFGDVRDTESGMKRDVRAAIEFVDPAADPAGSVDSLKHLDTRW
jgi:PAS domain-containing protein